MWAKALISRFFLLSVSIIISSTCLFETMAPKAGPKAKAKAKAKALAIRRLLPWAYTVAARRRNRHPPRFLILLAQGWSWFAVSQYFHRGGRSVAEVAGFLFAHNDADEVDRYISAMFRKMPPRHFAAIHRAYGRNMMACQRATQRGVGYRRGQAWGVTHDGVVTGFA